MKKQFYLIFVISLFSSSICAQHPFTHWTDAMDIRYSSEQPVVHYQLSVDNNDLSFVHIKMQLSNIPDTFYVAMAAHPEYDDRYWRYIENMYAVGQHGKGRVVRKDSALWQVISTGRKATLHYRIHIPSTSGIFRPAWKAFLSAEGGLVGGPHCFMYVLGQTLAPAHVTLSLPAGWQAVTGLQSTTDPHTFFASSVFTLLDNPVMIGKMKSWSFKVDQVPHRVTYWPWPAKEFDSIKLVGSIQKLVEQSALLFGRLPYRDYSFMLQDSSWGGLEHANSVVQGAPVLQINTNFTGVLSDLAHEYFHSWNLVRIRPEAYSDVKYKKSALSKGLWFSEGLTLFYADLLKRRAGLPSFDSTRVLHLQQLTQRYLANPAYEKFSAEAVSLASYAPIGMLGNHTASTHLQGEIIGAVLDIIIRHKTGNARSMDDVMRIMMERFSGHQGFSSTDIEKVTGEVCGCDMRPFFRDHVFGNKPINFDKYFALIGLQKTVTWKEVVTDDGKPTADYRAYTYQKPGESDLRFEIPHPHSAWAKAGLNTGDIIKSVNGNAINTVMGFRQVVRSMKIGDTITVEVLRPGGTWKTNVLVAGFKQPDVQISPVTNATEKQKQLLAAWERGN